MSILRGRLPEKILYLRRDKLGIFTGQVERAYHLASKENVVVQPAWLRDAPRPWQIPFKGAVATIAESRCIVTYDYEGTDPSEPDNDGRDESNLVVEFSGQMNEEDIRTHPNFEAIAKKYQWDPNKEEFPRYLTGTSASGLKASRSSGRRLNPAYGGSAFLSPGGCLTVQFAARSVPGYVAKDIGTVIQNPPGLSKLNLSLNTKRDWLKLVPDISDRGNIFQITMTYLLSGPKGFLKDVYSLSALQWNSDRSGPEIPSRRGFGMAFWQSFARAGSGRCWAGRSTVRSRGL